MNLFTKLEETKVLRCPIHTYIHIEYQIIWDLVNTFEFQRLRRISQLGGTKEVFPTSEHSRFMHCLGTYENARKIINEVKDVKEALSEREKMLLIIAALLHDLGHGPFSHCFEAFYKYDHEVLTSRIILENSEVNNVLNNYDSLLAKDVSSVLKGEYQNPLLKQLISSQLDVDRMDYLLRDAYFSGTPYGYFDSDRLLRVMRVKDSKIVFKESGINCIENYVLGRYHMYGQVYYHPVSLGYEVMIISFLNRLKDLYLEGYNFSFSIKELEPFILDEKIDVSKYVLLDDNIIYYYLIKAKDDNDGILSDLASRILHRQIFQEHYVKSESEVEELRLKVIDRGLDYRYYFYKEETSRVIYRKLGKDNLGSINILFDDGRLEELSEASIVVNSLQSKGNITEIIVYIPK